MTLWPWTALRVLRVIQGHTCTVLSGIVDYWWPWMTPRPWMTLVFFDPGWPWKRHFYFDPEWPWPPKIRRWKFSGDPEWPCMTLNDPHQSETTSCTPNATRFQVIRPFAPTPTPTPNPSQRKVSATNPNRQAKTTCCTPNATRFQVIRPFAPTPNPSQRKVSATNPNRQAKTTCCKL